MKNDRPPQAHAEAVQSLFESKAKAWGAKYGGTGPLRYRLDRFESALAPLVGVPARVLDLGCGTGDLAGRLAHAGYQVFAVDVSETMLAGARERFGADVRFASLPASWNRLPFDDGSFGAVVASSVLEYVDDLPRVMAELARVLRPGGVLVATVPDAGHPQRKIERLLAPVAVALRSFPFPDRVKPYLQYLRLSKNRLKPEGWIEAFREVGLLDQPQDAASDRDSSDPLLLLRMHRAVDRQTTSTHAGGAPPERSHS